MPPAWRQTGQEGRRLPCVEERCAKMPFYHTPSPLRGTPSTLEGEFKTTGN